MSYDAQRRGFLRGLAGLGAGLLGFAPGGCREGNRAAPGMDVSAGDVTSLQPSPPAPDRARPKVLVVRHRHCFASPGRPQTEALREMLEAGLCELAGTGSARDAWRLYFQPSDRIGLKLNCLAGRNLSSRPELVEAMAQGLEEAGIPQSQIIAWDRTDRELREAGYPIRVTGSGWRCFGTDNPSAGYENRLALNGSVGGLMSTILTRHITAQINIPVLKDHDLAGVSLSLKNNYGSIHNPNKYHDNHCDPFVADLNALPVLRDKQRLIVCDATTVQYHAGPAYKPQWAEPYGALLMATDPVALDAVGVRIIAELRRAHNLPSLEEEDRPPQHITTAAAEPYRLGVCDEGRMEVIETTI